MQPNQIRFSFIQTQEQVCPGPALSRVLSQPSLEASVHFFLSGAASPGSDRDFLSLTLSLWVTVVWHLAHLSTL